MFCIREKNRYRATQYFSLISTAKDQVTNDAKTILIRNTMFNRPVIPLILTIGVETRTTSENNAACNVKN